MFFFLKKGCSPPQEMGIGHWFLFHKQLLLFLLPLSDLWLGFYGSVPDGFGLTLCFPETPMSHGIQAPVFSTAREYASFPLPETVTSKRGKDSDLRTASRWKSRTNHPPRPARSCLFWNGSLFSLHFIQIILFTFTKRPLL